MRRRIVSIRSHDVPRDKLWRREDHSLRAKTTRVAPFSIKRDHVNPIIHRYQFHRGTIELNVCFRFLEQVLDQASIALGPRDQRLRFNSGLLHSRTEIKETSPCARLIEHHSVIVATRIINPPAQPRTHETTLVHPFANGYAIESRDFSVVGTSRHRKRKRAAALTVAPCNPPVNLGVELLKLLFVAVTRTGVKVKPFVPATFVKDAFFRIATKELLGNHGLAVFVFSFDDAHLGKKRDERRVLFHRRGNVVRAPGKGDRTIRAGARRSTRRTLELDENKIVNPE